MPPPTKDRRAVLRKVLILDAEGEYAGEHVLDGDCVVDFEEFRNAVGERELEDGETVFLGEHRATMVRGERLSLVAISKGPLGSEEFTWAKGVLVAAESFLTDTLLAEAEAEGQEPKTPNELKELEGRLADRERAVAEAEERLRTSAAERRQAMEGDLRSLWGRLEALELQRSEERAKYEAELAQLRKELERRESEASFASRMPRYPRLSTDKEQVVLEAKAADLERREESLRERESQMAGWAEQAEALRKENEALRTDLEAAKRAASPAHIEEAERDIELRIKMIHQKAMDLLRREENLRKREEELNKQLAQATQS